MPATARPPFLLTFRFEPHTWHVYVSAECLTVGAFGSGLYLSELANVELDEVVKRYRLFPNGTGWSDNVLVGTHPRLKHSRR